jgi:hypothetical protein
MLPFQGLPSIVIVTNYYYLEGIMKTLKKVVIEAYKRNST